MKILWLLAAAAVGFVLGSRAGRAPYERLESKVREVAGRPDVRRAVDAASDAVSDLTDTAVSTASDKVSDLSDRVSSKITGKADPNSAS
ncbi:MAG: YtxH domain-containing protein [Acidimicrobiales bacterium]